MQRQYLSIDIGGTTIKSARIDHSGNIMTKGRQQTPRSKDAFLQVLQTIIQENQLIAAVCVSVPGIVDPQTGSVQFTGVLSYMGKFELAQYLEKTTQLPVYVGNDANCATLAEQWLGNLVDVDNGAVITLVTSGGGGIGVNGKLLHGPHSRGGELSEIVTNRVDPLTEQRTVGATTSAVKMVEMVAQACKLPDPADGQQAFQKIIAHDPLAWEIFEEYCRRVAYLIVSLQAVLDLEVVLIGGGISVQPILIEEIKNQFIKVQRADRRLMADITMPVIKAANFGNEANLLGALYGLLLKIEK